MAFTEANITKGADCTKKAPPLSWRGLVSFIPEGFSIVRGRSGNLSPLRR